MNYPTIVNIKSIQNNINTLYFIRNTLGIMLLFFFPISTTLTSIITCLFIPISLATFTKKDFLISINNIRTIPILLFIGINLISILYTIGDIGSIFFTLKKYSKFLLIPILMPVFCEKRWQHLGVISFLSALLISIVYNIINFFFIHNNFNFKDRIYTSTFTAFGIFLLFWYIKNKEMHRFAKLSLIFILMVLIYYLIFINTGRTGQIIFFPLLILFIFLHINKKILAISLLSIFLFSFIIYNKMEKPIWFNTIYYATKVKIYDLPIFTHFKEVYDESKNYLSEYLLSSQNSLKGNSSSSIRLEFYLNTLNIIIKKPFLGYGVGSFPKVYNSQYPERAKTGSLMNNPHNQYLLTYMEIGFAGIATLLLIFLSLLFYRSRMDNFERTLSMGLFYFMIIGCILNSWLLDATSCYFFICFFALSGGSLLRYFKQASAYT